MSTTMKGLLKGLRYISLIFDDDDKEAEMEIGYPTDVKHVAHIGWDGPSVSSPSWMDEFKGPEQPSSEPLNTIAETQEGSITKSKEEKRKSSRHNHQSQSLASPVNSPTRRSRRNRSYDSPSKGSSSDSTSQHSRRHQNSGVGHVVPASVQDLPPSPKTSRHRRKSKGSSGGGSTRGSRSKGQNSLRDAESGFGSGSGHGLKSTDFEVIEEKKERD